MLDIKPVQIASTNWKVGRRVGETIYKPEAIVIHIADGTASGTFSWFQNPASAVSSHYVISRAGEVFRCVDEASTAFHAGKVFQPTWKGLDRHPGVSTNAWLIGIEHEGFPPGSPHLKDHPGFDVWTDAMYYASAQLIGGICERWGIIATTDTVVPHHWINAGHNCPGPACDVERLIRESRQDPE